MSYWEWILDDCKVGEFGVDMLVIFYIWIFLNDFIVFFVDYVVDIEILR